ncbi:AraC family transcriptional regulator [Chryseobacterium sp. Leaf404]|uniref:helix-turn-helix domain-containing protein n=1 Tax=unclassified Chryseobacterium TaxID=2593645 RepID=UPI0006F4A6B4|nr:MULTISPECIES: AraC family transcriptional regulator [unclassified Chryseobacterium]KQT20849.1 AraC family transcriptional regulator [Chryseobacterium sp. Leaf404]
MKHFKKISELHEALGVKPPENPLFSTAYGERGACDGNTVIEFTSDFYIIGFKKLRSGSMHYGKTKYDHDLGSMSFVKPQQKVVFKNVQLEEKGFLIIIHQDFLPGTLLHNEVRKYGYFDYEVNEALHLSPSEEDIIWNLYFSIEKEYHNNTDELSKAIIVSHLDSLLKYAQRFYKRQFINRKELTGSTVTKFNTLLTAHFEERKTTNIGLPTVSLMAEKLHISSRYLSDLLKQETGKTALELIHLFLIAEAKNLLTEGELNVTQISNLLGFENVTYFSRLFRKEVGITPNQYKGNSNSLN